MSEASAMDIVAAFKAACDLSHASIAPITASLSPKDTDAYRHLVGSFIGNAYLGVMRPLSVKFPGARMPDYDASAIPAQPDDIAGAFLARADAAIVGYRNLIEQGEADGTFRPGSLHDIEQARDALAAYFARS